MYEPIWQAAKGELSGERARDYTARIWEHARWNSFDRMQHTAAEIAAIMREIGLAEVDIRQYPADGVTAYGGWVMPQAWDVTDAALEIVEPAAPEPVLAHYCDCPQSLMTYSAPTPPEGIVAEVVALEKGDRPAAYEGRDVRGKLVLVDGVGLEYGMEAFSRGAAGVLSDAMRLAGGPCATERLEHGVQWHNYTVPPWRWEQKGFGFSLSPAAGRRLRALLREHPTVKLRAVVKTRLYDGGIPLVSGLLRGETAGEIALTGHLCEPGANDNCSGPALGLEVARTLKALCGAGKLPPLRRGLRLIFSFEVRGYQAFLATYPFLRRFVAGINLDMVGCDQSDARSTANLIYNFPSLPAYTDALGLELFRRLQRDDPLFRYQIHAGALVDNTLGEPAIGAPMCVVGSWPDATYHTSLDRMDVISADAMARMGRMVATYCAFLANAGFPEAVWLSQLALAHGEEEIGQAARQAAASGKSRGAIAEQLDYVARKNAGRLRSIARLVPDGYVVPMPEELAARQEWLCPWSHLFKDVELRRHLEERAGRLADSARRAAESAADARSYARLAAGQAEAAPAPEAEPACEEDRADQLVPRRTYRGSLCFESLAAPALAALKERTGIGLGWGAPYWLELAGYLSNGKRTVREIWEQLRFEAGVSLPVLVRAVEFLAEQGFVTLRPVLGREDFLAAFAEVGLPRGAVVMAHTSLSRFGYVAGGADTVIDALLEALGRDGTLAMPALSFSWVGHAPYDPAASPSCVGAISETFRKRPGVLRSGHPTHSVAALGPRAAEIVAGHTPDLPVFAREGAFGRLYDLDAWILMLAPLGSNTMMHVAEEWGGVPLPDFAGHVLVEGERREVVVRRAPWHANFDAHYALLEEREQIRRAPLGEETMYLMRARDAVDAALENVRADPLLVTVPGCKCAFCRHVRERR